MSDEKLKMSTAPSDIRQIIVMRNDLGMRKGKMIAQGAHASMKVLLNCRASAARHWVPKDHIETRWDGGWFTTLELSEEMYQWVDGIFTKICVRVDSEQELFEVYNLARAVGLPCALIQDAGLTEFKEPTYTCCAIGPATKAKLDPITGHLKLL